jgi:DNA end-binding protein Ku
VIVRPMEEGLAMHQLHFQAEIRQFNDLGVEPAKVSDAEMKLAEQLVDHLKTTRFDTNEYVDEYTQRVEAAIQEKIEGNEIALSAPPTSTASTGNVIDLMAALRASLQKSKSPDQSDRKAPKRAALTAAGKAPRKRGT